MHTKVLKRFLFLTLTLAFLPAGLLSSWNSSAPEAWDVWEQHNPNNSKPIDHELWNAFLEKYVHTDVSGLNRVSYAKVTSQDKAVLNSYIESLSQITISDRSRPVQLAYWINLYNALTVSVILEHYPVASIRDIKTSGLLASGPWGEDLVVIEEYDISLDVIEHEILRPIWKDPRIHYAVNCASIGCPNLYTQAFTSRNTNEVLETLAAEYINSSRGVVVKDEEIVVSNIYEWFAYDFGNSEGKILEHLRQYALPDLKTQLNGIDEISDVMYDWSLNE